MAWMDWPGIGLGVLAATLAFGDVVGHATVYPTGSAGTTGGGTAGATSTDAASAAGGNGPDGGSTPAAGGGCSIAGVDGARPGTVVVAGAALVLVDRLRKRRRFLWRVR